MSIGPREIAGRCLVAAVAADGLDASRVTFGAMRPDALPFELVSDYLVVTNGSVGDRSGLRFVVDTGTGRTVLDERIATALALPRRVDRMEVFGQAHETAATVVPSVSLGPIRATNLPVLIADLTRQYSRLGRIDVLLGVDVFRNGCLTIDYAAKELRFDCAYPQKRQATFVPPLPLIDVRIDGHPYRLLVDSASEAIVIFERSLPPDATLRCDREVDASHLTGTTRLKRCSPGQFDVGGHSIGTPPVFIMPTPQRVDGYDGVVGSRWLSRQQVQLDMRRGVVSWGTPPHNTPNTPR